MTIHRGGLALHLIGERRDRDVETESRQALALAMKVADRRRTYDQKLRDEHEAELATGLEPVEVPPKNPKLGAFLQGSQ